MPSLSPSTVSNRLARATATSTSAIAERAAGTNLATSIQVQDEHKPIDQPAGQGWNHASKTEVPRPERRQERRREKGNVVKNLFLFSHCFLLLLLMLVQSRGIAILFPLFPRRFRVRTARANRRFRPRTLPFTQQILTLDLAPSYSPQRTPQMELLLPYSSPTASRRSSTRNRRRSSRKRYLHNNASQQSDAKNLLLDPGD